MHRNTEETACNSLLPRIGELDGRDLGQNINAHGSDSNLVDHLLSCKGFRIYPIMLQRSPELFERCDYPDRILRRIAYPYVEIFRVTWLAVLPACVTTDNQILNL